MNKLENVRRRIQWLHSVMEGACNLSDIQYEALKSAKAFCGLDVSGLFDSISYNTLKSVLAKAGLSEFRGHPYGNNLAYFLDLRESCYRKAEAAKPKQATRRVLTISDWKEHYRNVLWHSNLCSEAYLGLRRDIQAILDADAPDARLDYKRIERVLDRSSSVYLKIVSATPEPFVPELKVV